MAIDGTEYPWAIIYSVDGRDLIGKAIPGETLAQCVDRWVHGDREFKGVIWVEPREVGTYIKYVKKAPIPLSKLDQYDWA